MHSARESSLTRFRLFKESNRGKQLQRYWEQGLLNASEHDKMFRLELALYKQELRQEVN